jgi:predicted N-acyltransferase
MKKRADKQNTMENKGFEDVDQFSKQAHKQTSKQAIKQTSKQANKQTSTEHKPEKKQRD